MWDKLKKAWKWFDGKKTGIGTTMLIASEFFKPYTAAYQILKVGGTLLGGTGTVHKIEKSGVIQKLASGLSDRLKKK